MEDEARPPAATAREELVSENGLSLNGFSSNGLSSNGLSSNGLSSNGLSSNGLQSAAFSTWFNANLGSADAVMHYVVLCAAPFGATRTWTNPSTGVQHVWFGWLGLATSWAAGSAASQAEQQIISACLAAHVNRFGSYVPISVQGTSAQGVPIPVLSGELTLFSKKEGCFFGNVFNGEGVWVGDDTTLTPDLSTTRCAGGGMAFDCTPVAWAGKCASLCTTPKDATAYASCSINGKTYSAITTRLLTSSIYRCGDGFCQTSESCGTKEGTKRWSDCALDCGECD